MFVPNGEPHDVMREPSESETYAQKLQRIDENIATIRDWVVFCGRLAIVLLALFLIEKLGWADLPLIEVR